MARIRVSSWFPIARGSVWKRTYPWKHQRPGRKAEAERTLTRLRHRLLSETDDGKRPPKRAIAPSHQAQELTRISDGQGRLLRQEDASIVTRKTPALHDLAQDLQRETALAQGPAQDHELIRLLLRREAAVEQPRQEDGVVGDGQRHGEADEQVADDDDGHLLGVGERAVTADDAPAGGGSEGGDEGQDDGGRDARYARRLDADEEVREADAGDDGQGGVDPPQHVDGLAPPPAPLAHHADGDHLDDDGAGDGDAGEAGGFDDVGRERGQDLFRVHGDAEEVGGHGGEEEDDAEHPEDVGDVLEAAELVVELVQDQGDDGCALRDEEPLRGEVAEDARDTGEGGEFFFAGFGLLHCGWGWVLRASRW